MKAREPSPKEFLNSCSEIGPDDGVDPRTAFRPLPPRVQNRKALQLCAQIAHTLNFALGWGSGDEVLRELTVASVVPAPNTAHLLVTVAASSNDLDAALIQERLQHASGRLRSEIAHAIHRKRVPLLSFQVCQDKKQE